MEQSRVSKVEMEKTGEVPTIYCNSMRLTMSQWDMALDVGQADYGEPKTQGEPRKVTVELKARIVMSPQHAKAVAEMLMQHVQMYEKDFGELSIKPKEQKKTD